MTVTGPQAPEPVVAREGWGVLHLFHRIDHAVARTLSPGAVKDLVTTLEQLAEETQLHLFKGRHPFFKRDQGDFRTL